MLGTLKNLLTTSASLVYVAGPELKDAIRVCDSFAQQDIASTIGYWDQSNEDPQLVKNAYLKTLDAIERNGLASYLSIKAPALGFSNALLTEVIYRSCEVDVGIHFDSLHSEAADQTFELIAKAVQNHHQVGCTLPGRWRRSLQDARLAANLGVNIRVVKGQWQDPDHPDIDLREGYLSVIDQLAGKAKHVAVATHDPPLARKALHCLQKAGTSCELELLFGLPVNAVMQVARDMDVRIRVYVPYGTAYLPYTLSQVRKKPHILLWFMNDLMHGNRG